MQDMMRYDLLAQDALRGVVKLALHQVKRSGLPGEHHFFIAFNTQHPEVKLSPRLISRYPEEMTVVMQHQFWNLNIYEKYFEVELSFDNVMEKLVIPFAAIKGFFDPSVQFGLQFETIAEAENEADSNAESIAEAQADNAPTPINGDKPGGDKSATGDSLLSSMPSEPITASNDSATVVSLDAFRKK